MINLCSITLTVVMLFQSIASKPVTTPSAEQGIAALKKRAEAGDPKAQVQLATAYASGDGVTEDGGRVAHPFAFQGIVCAPYMNTTPARLLAVNILNFGCPVLDALQGRGFYCKVRRAEGLTKEPRPIRRGGRKTGTQRSSRSPGPPARSIIYS